MPLFVLVCVWATALLALLGAMFCWASLRVRLELDSAGLRGRTYLGGFRTIAWDGIAQVRYSRRFKSLRIHGPEGAPLVANPWMPGFPVLLEQLRQRVRYAVREPAVGLAAVDPIK